MDPLRPARLFFALWPGEAVRARLATLAEDMVAFAGGRVTPPEKIHLTLAFLGNVPRDGIPALEVAAAAVEARPFAFGLGRTGSFRRARVGWVGAETVEPALLALQAVLARRVREAGFVLEDRPFVPHVTLARGIERPVPRAAIPPVQWRVEGFSLVESEPGTGSYATRGSWALR